MRVDVTNQPQRLWSPAWAALLLLTNPGSDYAATNRPPHDVLLIDSLGGVVRLSTNDISQNAQPASGVRSRQLISDPIEGANVPEEILQRQAEARAGLDTLRWFPAVPPRLMPYLASFDEHGNSAIRPGALLPQIAFEWLHQGKYRLAEYGLRYSLEQTFTYANMTEVMNGDHNLGYYTLDLKAKWAIFDAPTVGTAGWISSQIEAKTGLGSAGDSQSAKSNLGALTDPTGIWSSVNGFRVPELSWQESLRDGEIVVVAGMISQRNYLDGNASAHTGRGEFINSGLIHSQVVPLAENNFGLNLQWQPKDEWYAMFGASAGNAPAGHAPWTDFDWDYWSLVWECGYAPENFFGLGPGIYRIQPFVARAGGLDSPTRAGLGFNVQQRLGVNSPFAWFGRFGFSSSDVSATADAQIGTGFLLHAPLKQAGLVPRLSNDLLGLGFVWSQPGATTKTVYHSNEYVLETFYTLQLTPTLRLQPDLQSVWNPVFNPAAGPALVCQVQLILAW